MMVPPYSVRFRVPWHCLWSPPRQKGLILFRQALAESPGRGLPVILYAPKSNGAHDFREVTRWLMKHLCSASNEAVSPS
ncbi:MAG: hypothetical protein KAU41_07470 [Deltaproteobacteria bacterium]|nr:hypothetical protein [Deltaproteobacteria bacterium]